MPHFEKDQVSWAVSDFLLDRQSRGQSQATLDWYRRCTTLWNAYLHSEEITRVEDVTSSHVRRFLVHLTERGHTQGGIVTIFTGVKAFLRWYADEYAPDGWNPLAKVKTPKRPQERLEPLPLSHFLALVESCPRHTFLGDRDRALFMLFLDTGLRHQETTDLLVGDVDIHTGQVLVRMGKGRKGRAVFIGVKTRRAFLAYFRHREVLDNHSPLWVKQDGGKLSRSAIRQIVRRAASRAGVEEPGMHAFRRAFAINSLRNGMDVATLQRLMGHSTLEVVNRYLALVDDDLRAASAKFGVVDGLKGQRH